MTPEQQAVAGYLRRRNIVSTLPKAALIDMDGTLYDSMPRHAEAWYRLMTEAGVKCTREEFYLYEGRTGRDTIKILFKREFDRAVSDEECAEMYYRKTIYFNELPPVEPMPGADKMIGEFRGRGISTVLVTGSGQHSLLDRLERDFPGAFPADLRITSHDVLHGKPHPEPYLKAMQRVGVTPECSIAVDNAPMGVISGAESGAFTIGVTTGPIPEKALVDAGADIVYSSMPELAQRLPLLLDAFAEVKL